MATVERIMALDVGDVRIGIALSDALGWTAQGLETYTRKDDGRDVAYIVGLADEKGAKTLLFGMPRNMNGTYGPQSEKVRAFAALFEGAFGGAIEFYDERLTTMAAERVLLEADVSRAKRKKVIDKLAATVILQGYLDGKRN